MSKVSIDQINETLDRVAQRLDRITEVQQRDKEAQGRETEAQRRETEAQWKATEAQRRETEAQWKATEAQRRDTKAQQMRQKELDKSLDQLTKTVNKFAGESSHQWGKFIEVLTSSSAIRLLNNRGIKIETVSTRVKDVSPNRRWEIDVLAVNGKECVAIEVKRYLRKEDIDQFVKTLHKFKTQHKDSVDKVLYGGVAYLECEERIDKYAEERGLFVFQVTGNSAILNNRPDFKPKPIQII